MILNGWKERDERITEIIKVETKFVGEWKQWLTIFFFFKLFQDWWDDVVNKTEKN